MERDRQTFVAIKFMLLTWGSDVTRKDDNKSVLKILRGKLKERD